MLRLAIVAGETSGDLLGAGLLAALREAGVDVQASGIGGPRMLAEGLTPRYPMERLAVMGLWEVLGRYRELHAARERLIEHWIGEPPDVFVGIDAPDFNLVLEDRLHAAGIRTVHYVGPQVWAWRRRRIALIRRAVERMLVLFPFEVDFYARHDVAAVCVGHPLADAIPLDPDPAAARRALGLAADGPLLGLLPGSRAGELQRHLGPFLATARWCQARRPALGVLVAAVHRQAAEAIRAAVARDAPDLAVQVVEGRSHEVMQAADVLLSASGTATLEAMLFGKPMVVAYRMAWPTWLLVRWLVRVEHCALPNLLAGERLVPEFLQSEVRPDTMGPALLHWLDAPGDAARLRERFRAQHLQLRRDASRAAARAVLEVVGA